MGKCFARCIGLGLLVAVCLMSTGCPGGVQSSDFVGTWTLTDPERTYSEYHAFMEFKSNGTFWVEEYFWGYPTGSGGDWLYDGTNLWFQGDNGGGEFIGEVDWHSDYFRAVGHWSNGLPGTIDCVRTVKSSIPPIDPKTPAATTAPEGVNSLVR